MKHFLVEVKVILIVNVDSYAICNFYICHVSERYHKILQRSFLMQKVMSNVNTNHKLMFQKVIILCFQIDCIAILSLKPDNVNYHITV